MSGRGSGPRVKKVMTQPAHLIYEYLKNRDKVLLWLYENTSLKLEGIIIGFDEYMNVVLDEACEINTKNGNRRQVGRILLKGDCITLIQRANPQVEEN